MTDYPSFLEVKLKNRSVLASGILGVTISSLRRVYNDGAGIVTTKSVGPEKRNGHSAPVIYDWGCGLINAVGLSTPGIDEFVSRFGYEVVDFPLIVSIFGKEVDDFPLLAQKLDCLDFTFLELNISCPNVMDELGTPFSFSAELASQITRSVKDRTCKPVIVKLSPNTQDLVSVARSAENSGADAICIMNTVGPGMVIDISTGFPVLWNKRGGISGDAVLPLTVKNVYDVYNEVSIPIIGTGGVSSTGSALQVMMAGASLYGIGSAVYTKGLRVFKDIEEGILEFLHNNHFESSEEVIGLAHKQKLCEPEGYLFRK
ncbi:Dihydroorotate dehydrogenase B (NAD(+)), catalytic subunit [subsurface metagenome]